MWYLYCIYCQLWIKEWPHKSQANPAMHCEFFLWIVNVRFPPTFGFEKKNYFKKSDPQITIESGCDFCCGLWTSVCLLPFILKISYFKKSNFKISDSRKLLIVKIICGNVNFDFCCGLWTSVCHQHFILKISYFKKSNFKISDFRKLW